MPAEARFVVAVVDDDAGFREAAAWLLGRSGYAVQPYPDAATFLGEHDVEAVGCLLLDLRLGTDSGIDALGRVRQAGFDMPIIMISGYGDIPVAVRAVQLGATGFIEKPVDNQQLLQSVADACAAHEVLCRKHGRAMPALQRYALLTARERDIFWGMIDGLTTKEIAIQLDISVRTAETHRARVFQKWGGGGVAELHAAGHHLRGVRPSSP